MKKIIALVLLLSTNQFFSQEKIGNKIYSYGNVENSIVGKTIISYGFNDPKSEKKIIEKFKDLGVDAISWNKLFIPSSSYSDREVNTELNNNEISTVILIKPNGKSNYTQSNANTTYNGLTNSINTSGSSSSVIGNMGIVFEIYNRKNNFNKPAAVINANGSNSWGAAGSERGLVLKIVDRVLSSLEDEKAYNPIGYFAATESDYSKILSENPNNVDALFERALVKSEQNDGLNGAIEDYNTIINLEGKVKPTIFKMSTVYNNKAYCLVRLGNYEAALPLVNKALELDKTEGYIWDTRGELNYKLNKYQECIADMDKAISIKETNNSLYYRGIAKIKLGQKTQGCEDLSRSKTLGNSDASKEIDKLCK